MLTVTALGGSFSQAAERCYDAARAIRFDGMQHRTDIARDAIEATSQKD